MTTDRLYFAYGSNLSSEELARWRLTEHLTPVGPAWLADHDLAFTRKSKTRKGGVLDVLPTRGSLTPGFLFRPSAEGWSLLDEKEGAPGAYERFDAWAFDETDRLVPVCTYRVRQPRDHVAPSDEYVSVVRAGREERGLETGDLEHVARGDRRANALGALFVYGTLLRGEIRADVLAERHPTCWLLAEAFGELRDCGGYPGLILQPGSENLIQGEFARFDEATIASVLAATDAIEGFHGHGDADRSLFVRRPMSLGIDGRERRAWVYVLGQPEGAPVISSGDWRAHHGRRETFLERLVSAHLGGRSAESAAREVARHDGPFGGLDPDAWRALLPLPAALARGEVSERALAQLANRWVVVPV